jgi:hypothetical protein
MFGVFLDIEGAFDSTLHILIEAARWRGLQYSLSEEPLKKKILWKKVGELLSLSSNQLRIIMNAVKYWVASGGMILLREKKLNSETCKTQTPPSGMLCDDGW